MDNPIPNGENGDGRDPKNGRFMRGNRGGPGNPSFKLLNQVRDRLTQALHKSCSPQRLLNVVDAILKQAEGGDVSAARLIFERIAGPALNAEVQARVDAAAAVAADQPTDPNVVDYDGMDNDELEVIRHSNDIRARHTRKLVA